MIKRFSALALPVVAAVALVSAVPSAALAATPVTAAPHGDWGVYASGPDSTKNYANVYSIVRTPDRIYLAGKFSSIKNNRGTGEKIPAKNIAALFPDGTPDRSFNAGTDGAVRRMVLGPDGKLYLGGVFTKVLIGGVGVTRKKIARLVIDAGKPTLDATWAPPISGTNAVVYAISFQPDQGMNSDVYVGGTFSLAGGQARVNLAAFDILTDGLLPWAPTADNGGFTDIHGPSVRSILFSGASSYIGGEFDQVNGDTTKKGVAALNADGTTISTFKAPFDNDNDVFDLVLAPYAAVTALWAAGAGVHNDLRALSPGTGAIRKLIPTDGDVQSIAVQDGFIYLGGHFLLVGGTTATTGTSRIHTARVFQSNGGIDSSWAPAMNPTQESPYFFGVWSVVPYFDGTKSYVYEGGAYRDVGTIHQNKFTWFESS